MGKKGIWCCVDKRLFTSNSKPLNDGEKNSQKEKKKKRRKGTLRNASFIPIFREPSSIEDILGEVDQHHLHIGHHPTTQPQPGSQPQPDSQPQPNSQPQPQPQPDSQPQPEPQPDSQPLPEPQPDSQPQPETQPQPQPQPRFQPQPQPPEPQPKPKQKPNPQPSSSSKRPVSPPTKKLTSPPRKVIHQQPKISHTPEPTLQQHHLSATKIQAAYRGYMTRRNIGGGLTGLVRLKRVLTSQNVKRQTVNAMKQMQLLVRVQTQIQSQRNQKLKNQALKPQPNNSNTHKQLETGDEYWDDSVITKEERDARLKRKEVALINREKAMVYAYSHQLRKEIPTSSHQTDGFPWWWKWLEPQLPYHVTPTPPSPKTRQFPTRIHKQLNSPSRPTSSSSTNRSIKYSKERKRSSFYPKNDDDSLMSCPPFSVPNYMSPTASARAKARPVSNPKERWASRPTTPASVTSSKRRFSFPFTPNNNSPGSIGDMSVESAISMPNSMGRKPFNRFV